MKDILTEAIGSVIADKAEKHIQMMIDKGALIHGEVTFDFGKLGSPTGITIRIKHRHQKMKAPEDAVVASGWTPSSDRRQKPVNHYFDGPGPLCGASMLGYVDHRRPEPWPQYPVCKRCAKAVEKRAGR